LRSSIDRLTVSRRMTIWIRRCCVLSALAMTHRTSMNCLVLKNFCLPALDWKTCFISSFVLINIPNGAARVRKFSNKTNKFAYVTAAAKVTRVKDALPDGELTRVTFNYYRFAFYSYVCNHCNADPWIYFRVANMILSVYFLNIYSRWVYASVCVCRKWSFNRKQLYLGELDFSLMQPVRLSSL